MRVRIPLLTAALVLAAVPLAQAEVALRSSHCAACSSRSSCCAPCEHNCDTCDHKCDSCAPALPPFMIGDGGLVTPRVFAGLGGGSPTVFQNHIYKISENNSAVPTNRIGFNFNYLDGAYGGRTP